MFYYKCMSIFLPHFHQGLNFHVFNKVKSVQKNLDNIHIVIITLLLFLANCYFIIQISYAKSFKMRYTRSTIILFKDIHKNASKQFFMALP